MLKNNKAITQDLQIIFRRLAELKPDPANPRQHSKKQIGQIAKSISNFGFNVPILIDRHGNVIGGHGRVLACDELGIDEVPTVCLDHLTPAQARAFRIADNKLTENATWDDRLLAEQLRDLSLSGLDFDVEVTGFEMGEIDLRIASLEDTPAVGPDPAYPRFRWCRRSASLEICGCWGVIAFYAATLSIPRPLPR
jgi:ParB-like chromosome segregation protein Spo0J